MPDLKISQMTLASTLDGTEIVPLVQTGTNVQTTTADFVSQVLDVNPVLLNTQVTNTLSPTHGGTGLSTYTTGDILYASATNTLAKLAGNTTTTNKFLRQTGTGSASSAPDWDVIDPSDINTQYGAFHYDYTTSLTSAINNSVTTIPVVSTTGFSSTGAIIIENELITYTGITATSFTGCTRHVNGSAQASHTIGTAVGGAQVTSGTYTPTLLQINTTDLSNGVSLNLATSEISVAVAGTYNIQYSLQIFNPSNTQDLVNVWYVLDGSNVASSASWATVAARSSSGTPASTIMTVNLFLTLTTSNKLTLKWLSETGNSSVVTYPSGTGYPSAPAVIVTVNQVS
ncbi:hypothetical protein EB001_04655 [bacterium]|nr:hypothetical protein [bacterium]